MTNEFDAHSFLLMIGNNLLKLRKKHDLNQEQMAGLAGYEGEQRRVNIHRLEKGLNDIPITKIGRLCHALKVPISEILSTELTTDAQQTTEYNNNCCGVSLMLLNMDIYKHYVLLDEDDRRIIDSTLETMIRTMLSAEKYKKEAMA